MQVETVGSTVERVDRAGPAACAALPVGGRLDSNRGRSGALEGCRYGKIHTVAEATDDVDMMAA